MTTIKTNPNFSTNPTNNKELYPTVISYYSLQDCTPNNARATYKLTDNSDNDDFDGDDDQMLQIEIPNRFACYQLISDLCKSIQEEIQGYAQGSNPMAPADDATDDISIASDLIHMLTEYDTQF